MVFGVDEEDYAGYFGEIIFPETAGWDEEKGGLVFGQRFGR